MLLSLPLQPNIAAECIFSKFKRHPTLFVPPGLSSPWRLRLSIVAGVTLQTSLFFFVFFKSTPYWAHYHSYNSPTASTACLQLTRNRLLSPPGPIKFGSLLSRPPPPPCAPSLFLFSSSFLLQTSLCADRAVSQPRSVPLLLPFTIPPIHSP